jgi:gas vesicle protein
MNDNNDFGTFFAGLIVGGLVGAAVALLLAPQSGEETRTVIANRGIELKDQAVAYSADAGSRAQKAFDDAKQAADAAMEDLRMRADDLAKATRNKVTPGSKSTILNESELPSHPVPEDTAPAVGE